MKSYVFDGQTAFMPHPALQGIWLRVHPCVIFIACPACDAAPGERCNLARGQGASTHYDRRGSAWRRWRKDNAMKWGKGRVGDFFRFASLVKVWRR